MTQSAAGSGDDARGRAPSPVLALDLGGTRLRAAVVRPDGTLIGRVESRTPRQANPGALVEGCVSLLDRARGAAASDMEAPHALGISAPGPLDPWRGVLLDPPNLARSLWDFPLASALADRIGLPAVMQKDTNVAALAEGRFGSARGLSEYVYLTVSTGVGGAVVSSGRLLSGADGVAGELGHLTVDPEQPICGCGGRGHLEAISSGTGIAAAARTAIEAGRAAPGSPLARLALEGRTGGLEARDVALAEDSGDPLAAEIMGRARSAFAAAVVIIVNVFNPARVIVGGGIAMAQGERLLDPARQLVRREAFRVAGASVEIVPAALGDDVGLVGALPLVATMLGESARTTSDDDMGASERIRAAAVG